MSAFSFQKRYKYMKDNLENIHARAAHATFRTRDELALISKRQGANLPHWTAEGAIYHVRYRLADALPVEARKKLMDEREQLQRKIKNPGYNLTPFEKRRLTLLHSEKIDKFLDVGYGECWLARHNIAEIVIENLNHFTNIRYELFAWCVMPNHIHVIFQPLADFKLPDIVHSWKSYTSKKANRLLGMKGKFWQQEYFDRVLRDSDELEYCMDYVYLNPEKAGLSNWTWRWRMPA